MNKSESKYYNTACLMDEALLQLLEKKDFDYITVKEICVKAGVNRSTFYLHYENMNDLLQESLTYLFSRFKEKYDKMPIDNSNLSTCPLEDLYLITPKYIKPYLEFIKENKKIFLTAIVKPTVFSISTQYDAVYKAIFNPILSRFGVPEKERRYIMSFYISGMHSVIIQWVKGGCKDEIDFIAEFLIKYTLKYKI